jgi:tetratricopeptide (TPR) repeat protein
MQITSESVFNFRKRIYKLKTQRDISKLSDELQIELRKCHLTDEMPFYNLLSTYCDLMLGDFESAVVKIEEANTQFRIIGNRYNQAITSMLWSLFLNFDEKEQEKAIVKLGQAIKIISDLETEAHRLGHYELVEKYRALKHAMEAKVMELRSFSNL